MTRAELNETMDRFLLALGEYGATSFDHRAIWELRKELFESFKRTVFADNGEKQETWNRMQELLDTLKEKQDKLDKEHEKFALEAENRIEAIREAMGDETQTAAFTKERFSEIKKQITETAEFIRQNNWPAKERRTAAWETFKQYRELLKQKEDAFYGQLREEKTKQSEHSASLSQALLYAIRTCHPATGPERLAELPFLVASLVNPGENNPPIDTGTDAGDQEEKDKPKNPLKIKSDSLKQLWKWTGEKREEMTREDRQMIYNALGEVQEELDKAWTVYKEELQKKKEEWEEKRKLREQKHTEWEQKQKDFLARLDDRLAKQIAFKEKLAAIYEKQNAFWERLEKRITTQQDFLQQLHVQISGLEDKYAMTNDGKFREKISEWIAARYSKITEVELDITDMSAKIENARNNIDELPARIKEVEQSISDIRLKMEEVKQNLLGIKPV